MNTEMFSKAGVLWASWMPRKPAAPSSPLPPTVSLPSSPSALPRTTGGSGVCSSIIFWRRTTRAKNSGAKLSTVLSHGGGSENTLPAHWVTSPQRPHPASPWLQASCGHPQWALHCSWEKCGSEDEILDDHTVLAQHCGSICCVFLSTAVFFSSRIHSSFTYFLFSQSRCAFLSPWPFLPSDKPSTMSSLPHLSSPERVLFCTRTLPTSPFLMLPIRSAASHLCPGFEGMGSVSVWQVSKGSCHTQTLGLAVNSGPPWVGWASGGLDICLMLVSPPVLPPRDTQFWWCYQTRGLFALHMMEIVFSRVCFW